MWWFKYSWLWTTAYFWWHAVFSSLELLHFISPHNDKSSSSHPVRSILSTGLKSFICFQMKLKKILVLLYIIVLFCRCSAVLAFEESDITLSVFSDNVMQIWATIQTKATFLTLHSAMCTLRVAGFRLSRHPTALSVAFYFTFYIFFLGWLVSLVQQKNLPVVLLSIPSHMLWLPRSWPITAGTVSCHSERKREWPSGPHPAVLIWADNPLVYFLVFVCTISWLEYDSFQALLRMSSGFLLQQAMSYPGMERS